MELPKLTAELEVVCPRCAHLFPAQMIRVLAAEIAAAQPPGRHKITRPCPHCGAAYGAKDMRHHIPRCDANPRARKRQEEAAA